MDKRGVFNEPGVDESGGCRPVDKRGVFNEPGVDESGGCSPVDKRGVSEEVSVDESGGCSPMDMRGVVDVPGSLKETLGDSKPSFLGEPSLVWNEPPVFIEPPFFNVPGVEGGRGDVCSMGFSSMASSARNTGARIRVLTQPTELISTAP